MSSILLKCGQLARCRIVLGQNSVYNSFLRCHTLRNNYQFDNQYAIKNLQQSQMSTMPPKQSQDNNDGKGDDKNKQDAPEYIISFKPEDVKYQIKQFYSFYGPLFVVCHIGVGLASLGFFCSLVWLNVELSDYIPGMFMDWVGDTAAKVTGASGKFIIAYAVHKVLLPFRLMIALSLTRFLSPKLKMLKNKHS